MLELVSLTELLTNSHLAHPKQWESEQGKTAFCTVVVCAFRDDLTGPSWACVLKRRTSEEPRLLGRSIRICI